MSTADNATRERRIAATKARKAKRVEAQETRRTANVAALGSHYNPTATMTQYRWKQLFEKGTKVWKLVPFHVSLSPSKQVNRLRFQSGEAA